MLPDLIDELTFPQEFKPTPAMKLFAYYRAKDGESLKIKDICKATGVRPETYSRWRKVKGFDEWLSMEVLTLRRPIHSRLEQVALEKIHDFKFWQSLALKSGFLNSNPVSEDTSHLLYIPRASMCRYCIEGKGCYYHDKSKAGES